MGTPSATFVGFQAAISNIVVEKTAGKNEG